MEVSDLLNRVKNGNIVLPEFQRSFIWEPEDVRELLVSILGGYSIGSMLTIDAIKDNSPFALRLIEGANKVNDKIEIQNSVNILLDGQQRTTALFYALYGLDIPLKGRKSPYKFFIDLDKALNEEWDDAVICVSINDKKKLSKIEDNPNVIPIALFNNIGELATELISRRDNRDNKEIEKIINIANGFMNYKIHIVNLPMNTNLEKIVETFERINRTGEPLSIFELLTAKLYKDNIKLRDLWENAKEKYTFAKSVEREFIREFILKVISLMRGKEPKRRNILELQPKNFEDDWERACEALQDAYTRVTDVKNGYGVFVFDNWMPYPTMLVPLAAILDFIKTEKKDIKNNYEKIDKWYWISIFSNRYDQAVDTTSSADFKILKEWITDDNKKPDFIQKFNPEEVDLDTDKQKSAVYRGVINLIVLEGALDFQTGQPPQFDPKKIQDDHIFPKSIYKDDCINCIANKTLISTATNTEKSNKKPSAYFKKIRDTHKEEKLIEILKSHIIPEDALDDLLNDNKENFIVKRKEAIKNILKKRCKNDTT